MIQGINNKFKKTQPDFLLFCIVFLLVVFGIIMVFSASCYFAQRIYNDSLYFFKRHLLSVFLGLIFLFIGLRIDYFKWKKYSGLILLINIVLLFLVYFPKVGFTAGGSSRWLNFFGFKFQPSEVLKIFFVMVLAQIISNKKEKMKNFSEGFFPVLLIFLLIVALIAKQPDLGTALIITALFFVMTFLGGARFLHLLGTFIFLLLVVIIVVASYPYQQRRFLAFLNPWKDPLGSGFHIIQSFLAVGSGGLWGLGLGASRQKLAYLPQQFSDFIFAIICEELGFFGGVFVLACFGILIIRGLFINRNAIDSFGKLLSAGIISWFIIQAIINIGVVLGVFPVTGIPLTFISYGGTALTTSLFAVGILLNISRFKKE